MDKLTFDLASEVDGAQVSPFVSKQWLSIMDSNSQNYASSQCVIDTSQLSNSNKWLSYREAYLQVPIVITVTSDMVDGFAPATAATDASYLVGLKNWYGSFIHSMSVSYNGSIVIQQQGFQSMLNSFKLMTSLSWSDVSSMGSSLGFYPDDPLAFSSHVAAGARGGVGTCNNRNAAHATAASAGVVNSYNGLLANDGFRMRQSYINFDVDGGADALSRYSDFITTETCDAMYKSHVMTKIDAVTPAPAGGVQGVFQIAATCTIMLRHLHGFFEALPLIKGAFMTITLQLNNCTTVVNKGAGAGGVMTIGRVNSAVGGINPLMFASREADCGGIALGAGAATVITASVAVGSRPIEASHMIGVVAGVRAGAIGTSLTLNVPSYQMNPIFEQSYLSDPIRAVPYTDFYTFTVVNVPAGGTISSLLTNGIAGLRRLTVFPVFSSADAANTFLPAGMPVYHSPFDTTCTSGGGSPLAYINQFQVVVAGANVLAQQERYTYEQWLHELSSCGAVNGGLTDGVTSGLLSQAGWEMAPVFTCDLSRMLPAERTVPKSVQLQGINASVCSCDYICFLEFDQAGLRVSVLDGSRS